MRKLHIALALSFLALVGHGAAAQGLFSPVVRVNGDVITRFELEQREQMLILLGSPGDPAELAREQLVDDRLRVQAAKQYGVSPSEDAILEGMSEFAARADLTREKFIEELGKAGVAEQTLRDFIYAGIAWRSVVQGLYGSRSAADEAEIDRAVSSGSGGQANVRVLLSEIIIPLQPGQEEAARELAAEISRIETLQEFNAAAREYSAARTRNVGGRLGWQNLDSLAQGLQPIVLALAEGEVTDPLPIGNAIALFQLRAIEETGYSAPEYAALEYAMYYMPGGQSAETLKKADKLASQVDRCDDLYGVAQGQPEEVLERVTLPPSEIPGDILGQLDLLDAGEISTALTRNNGQTLVFLMMCGRSTAILEDEDRQRLALGLQNRRLTGFANSYLAQLRSDARIIEP